MSTADDPDAVLRDLEASLGELEQPDVLDLSKLPQHRLSEVFNDTRDELNKRGEMMEATTPQGRELHSLRAACLVEMARRRSAG
jgi:hypothetical protein